MTRVKRGTISVKRRRKVLKQTKGFRWGRKSKERAAREGLLHAGVNRFQDNRKKKRTARKLWEIKINAAARLHGISYSKLMGALKKASIEIDRKILAELAVKHPKAFEMIVKKAVPAK
ncbi:MAG: 50S ribosomal protein L20 [Candidatus Ryanbacteria bacterium RIFCSPHIGHO2_02_FULL_48_12]|uniref:Large ribosomal subunit protein bL20 n=1 Tax=Candidatus Ryanbacteria bacterium RIFCSPHIGHO2_01_FULL_48_27 TaxID=1802115 RepID=A0A1G2G523_9BACT|nr:MAG: 50S ribosomal protein L20 [Candidatus Ryanbacteria bacterium RIFCSPHIGHO2_01_FULL_48_27]OGZ50741.1 MAG: 50S ribosomal protein L20 [Candidatus Ryanbacteria bacterium RIFCSPHIGHO2_02_FULL_48_12]